MPSTRYQMKPICQRRSVPTYHLREADIIRDQKIQSGWKKDFQDTRTNLPTAFLNRGVADMDVAHYEEQMGKEESLMNERAVFTAGYYGRGDTKSVAEVLRSGWITTGPKTKEFERRIAEYRRTSKAVCLNSATACLEMTLRVMGIRRGRRGDDTTPYTYTANMQLYLSYRRNAGTCRYASGTRSRWIRNRRRRQ